MDNPDAQLRVMGVWELTPEVVNKVLNWKLHTDNLSKLIPFYLVETPLAFAGIMKPQTGDLISIH